jgi:hypothetical protein
VATGSARILADLEQVAAQRGPWHGREPVAHFLDLVNSHRVATTP